MSKLQFKLCQNLRSLRAPIILSSCFYGSHCSLHHFPLLAGNLPNGARTLLAVGLTSSEKTNNFPQNHCFSSLMAQKLKRTDTNILFRARTMPSIRLRLHKYLRFAPHSCIRSGPKMMIKHGSSPPIPKDYPQPCTAPFQTSFASAVVSIL